MPYSTSDGNQAIEPSPPHLDAYIYAHIYELELNPTPEILVLRNFKSSCSFAKQKQPESPMKNVIFLNNVSGFAFFHVLTISRSTEMLFF